MLARAKVAGIALVALLAVIVVLQNTAAVETKVLFLTLRMPRAALLFGALAVGFAVGVLVGNRITSKKAG